MIDIKNQQREREDNIIKISVIFFGGKTDHTPDLLLKCRLGHSKMMSRSRKVTREDFVN